MYIWKNWTVSPDLVRPLGRVGYGGATRRASAVCSRWVYRVSASVRDLLMKNIGLCFWFSSSLNKAALTETSDTVK